MKNKFLDKDPMLDEYEKEILESLERGEWTPVEITEEEREQWRIAAQKKLRERTNVTVRISLEDVANIQTIAGQKGVSSQALMSSIIHKYAAGELVECGELMLHEESAPYRAAPAEKKKKPDCS